MARTTKARRIYDATMERITNLANVGGYLESVDYMARIDTVKIVTQGERDGWLYRRTFNELYKLLERDTRHYRTQCHLFDGDGDWKGYLEMRKHALRIMRATLEGSERFYLEF